MAASFDLGLPVTAYNLGVRGETSEQVAAGYDELADLILANGWANWLHTEPPG